MWIKTQIEQDLIGETFIDDEGREMEIVVIERYERTDTIGMIDSNDIVIAQMVGNTDPEDLITYNRCDIEA